MTRDQDERNSVHIPVLLREVIDVLTPKENGVYVDGTLGGGGHTEVLCRMAGPKGTVIALDRDLAAIDRSEKRLRSVFAEWASPQGFPIRFVHASYEYFTEVLDLLKIDEIDGLLLDLGLSSDQLADRRRGFSFESDGPLDLRFDPSEGETAAELLNRLKEEEIADLIFRFGEERYSRRIARTIVQRRSTDPIRRADQLAELVRRCVPGGKMKIDPATRTFQALRIAVNDELGSLRRVLELAPKRLKAGGVLAAISFHSLEDRIVKQAFREDERWEILTKKPILASEEEIERNPRARSAKLRAARRP